MKKIRLWPVIGASFLWMAFVYASFYLVPEQRPLDAVYLRAIGETLLNLLAAALLLLMGVCAGRRICRWLGISFTSPLEELVLDTGVGLGLLSLLVLALGLVGGLTRWAIAALLLGVLLFGTVPDGIAYLQRRRILPSRRIDRVGSPDSSPRPDPGKPAKDTAPTRKRLLAFYVGATFLFTLTLALSPPIDWDGLFYHLTLPKLYIEQAKIVPITDIPHQFFPGLVKTLYLAAMLIRGDIAAKLLHYGYLLLLAGIVYLTAEQHLGQEHAWPALTLYAAIPMVAVLGGWAYTDLALAFYQAAALYALLRWTHQQHLPWLALSGLLCGLAMGVKYTSVLCPLYLLLVVLVQIARGQLPRQKRWQALGLMVGASLLVAAPWYLRNLVWTGNPVFPFAFRWIGARPDVTWDEWRAAWYARAGSGLGWDIIAWIKLPWTLTLGVRDTNFFDGRIGPLFLLALPFWVAWGLRFFGRPGPRPPAIRILTGFGLLQYLAWMTGVINSRSLFQSRLLLSACIVLCGPIAYVYHELQTLDRPRFSLRRLIGMSVALVLAANLGYQAISTMRQRPLPVLVGLESRDDYLARNLGPHYAAMELLNERVPQDGRVLYLWEPRSYYSDVPSQPDPILDRWSWLVSRHSTDLGAIAGELRGQGYTHILYYRAGAELVRRAHLDPVSEQEWTALDRFIDLYLDPQAQIGEIYVLYALQ